jgi:energy-coupling factor transport system permease protein
MDLNHVERRYTKKLYRNDEFSFIIFRLDDNVCRNSCGRLPKRFSRQTTIDKAVPEIWDHLMSCGPNSDLRSSSQNSGLFRLDPRTKIGLLLLVTVSAATAPHTTYELGLVALITLLALAIKPKRKNRVLGPLLWLLIYTVVYLATKWFFTYQDNFTFTALLAFLGLVHKVFPCAFIGSLIISTTKTSEFLTAVSKLHIPKSFSIPLAIMLRYLPTVLEDFRYIKEAMTLRDVSPTICGFLTRPATTLECIYVPLLMAASKAADELTMASITRGIENPKVRTCFRPLGFKTIDLLVLILFAVFFTFGIFS